jgi:hypothetical protein
MKVFLRRWIVPGTLAAGVLCPLRPVLGVDLMQAHKPGAEYVPRLSPTKPGNCAQQTRDRTRAIMEGRVLLHDRNHVPARNGVCG